MGTKFNAFAFKIERIRGEFCTHVPVCFGLYIHILWLLKTAKTPTLIRFLFTLKETNGKSVFYPPPCAASAQNIHFMIFILPNSASPTPKTPRAWYREQYTAHFTLPVRPVYIENGYWTRKSNFAEGGSNFKDREKLSYQSWSELTEVLHIVSTL